MTRLPRAARAHWHAGTALIWIGGLLIFGGVLGGSMLAVLGVGDIQTTVAAAPRLDIDRGGGVFLDDEVPHYLYASGPSGRPSAADGTFVRVEDQVLVRVTDPEGRPLALVAALDAEVVEVGDESLRLIGTFDVGFDGRYVVEPLGGDGGGRYDQLLITTTPLEDDGDLLGASFLLGAVGVVSGLALLMYGTMRRRAGRVVRQWSAPMPMPMPMAPGSAGMPGPAGPPIPTAPSSMGAPIPGAWPAVGPSLARPGGEDAEPGGREPLWPSVAPSAPGEPGPPAPSPSQRTEPLAPPGTPQFLPAPPPPRGAPPSTTPPSEEHP